MNSKTWFISLLLLSLIGNLRGSESTTPADDFRTRNPLAWKRAVQDSLMEAKGDTNKLIQSAELAMLPGPSFVAPGMLLCDFDHEAGKLLPWMMAKLAAETNSEKISMLVPAIARQGPAAKAAIPVLRELLQKPGLDETHKIELRIALANLGHRPAELLARISSDLENTNGTPQNNVRMQTILALAWAQANDWITPTICAQLTRQLPAKNDTLTAMSLLALGAAGTNAQSAIPELIQAKPYYSSRDQYSILALINLAAYRIDPAHPRAYLQETLSLMSTNGNHTDFFIYSIAGSVFYDDKLFHEMLEQGKNWHNPAWRPAANFLACMGRPASAAVPQLLDCAQNSQDEYQRHHAIY